MTKIFRLILLLKKSIGEARWNNRYPAWEDKVEVFKILFRLRYLTEIATRTNESPTQKIFGFVVKGSSYGEILYLFREIFLEGQYEFKYQGDAPSILDCGANIGMAILFFKRMYPNCKVLAFEPNPAVYELLQQNINGNQLKNIQALNVGLSAQEGTMDFFIDRRNSLVSSIHSNRGKSELVQVKTTKLSTHLNDTQYDFAKIDIEGAEYELVKDLHENGKLGKINQYIFEYHHNVKDAHFNLSDFLIPFERSGFISNLKTSYQNQGDFQDVSIHFFKNK